MKSTFRHPELFCQFCISEYETTIFVCSFQPYIHDTSTHHIWHDLLDRVEVDGCFSHEVMDNGLKHEEHIFFFIEGRHGLFFSYGSHIVCDEIVVVFPLSVCSCVGSLDSCCKYRFLTCGISYFSHLAACSVDVFIESFSYFIGCIVEFACIFVCPSDQIRNDHPCWRIPWED